MMRILTLSGNNKDVHYCFHKNKIWTVELTSDDTGANNFIFRQRYGIPYWRAAAETSIGIVFVDDDGVKPRIRVLDISKTSDATAEVRSLSDNLNLENYRFTLAVVFEFGDYVGVACRTSDSTINNRTLIFNKKWKSWDILDYWISTADIYNGTLVAGDPIQNNCWTLFSGNDDDGSTIQNYWEGKLSRLQIEQLKRLKRLVIQGKIGRDQIIAVSLAIDDGEYAQIGTIVGNATYVDLQSEAVIGSHTLGSTEIGGGGDGVTAANYEREFKYDELALDTFEKIKIKFEATEVGYASVSRINYLDLRVKGGKIPLKYRA